MQIILIALYLMAIVAANLTVTIFGPAVVVFTSFLFIGLDLTTRDRLHEVWHNRGLVWKMGALIAAGSVISYQLNAGAAQVALASFVAFGLAALADTGVYALLKDVKWLWRSNGSNLASAAIDSIVFPTLAFGALLPLVILGQFAAKVAGGFFWSLVINYYRKPQAQAQEA